jgi:23S rRNA pseudouridine2605 synthase
VTEDVIEVDGKRLPKAGKKLYLMLNKPRGYVTTLSDEKGRKNAAELVSGCGVRVYPVGRLDRDSEGMLLLTNDGDFANAIMHPSTHVPKRYRVTVRGKADDVALQSFRDGIVLDGRRTLPADISVVSEEPERTVLEVVLYEGRNRQIRRMCEALGYKVTKLQRIRIMNIELGGLKTGAYRKLTKQELDELYERAEAGKNAGTGEITQ